MVPLSKSPNCRGAFKKGKLSAKKVIFVPSSNILPIFAVGLVSIDIPE